jgi:hypothetical protein
VRVAVFVPTVGILCTCKTLDTPSVSSNLPLSTHSFSGIHYTSHIYKREMIKIIFYLIFIFICMVNG